MSNVSRGQVLHLEASLEVAAAAVLTAVFVQQALKQCDLLPQLLWR